MQVSVPSSPKARVTREPSSLGAAGRTASHPHPHSPSPARRVPRRQRKAAAMMLALRNPTGLYNTCVSCSVRNVKCSESRPRCEQCSSRKLTCYYPFASSASSEPFPGEFQSPSDSVTAAAPITASKRTTTRQSITSISSASSASSSTCSSSPPTSMASSLSRSSEGSPAGRGSSSSSSGAEHARSTLAALGILTSKTSTAASSLSANELELLANWCTSTYRTITRRRSSEKVWQVLVPREALLHPPLLDGIFALSALQLAHRTNPDRDRKQRKELLHAAKGYWTRAHAGLEPDVDQWKKTPTPNDLSALLFATCCVQTMSAFAIHRLGRTSTSFLEELCLMFRQMRGPTEVMGDLIEAVQVSHMASLIDQDDNIGPTMPNTSALAILAMKRLVARQAYPGLESQLTKAVYSDAIDQLGACLSYTSQSSDPGLVGFSWILGIPPDFLDYLEDHQPLALIVLAHYCVVMYHLRERWWMGDWGLKVLEEIRARLGRDEVEKISWALDASRNRSF